MITGGFEEPFIKAAVDSALGLVDELVFVDTFPGNNPSSPYLDFLKESCIKPVKIVEMPRGEDKDFSFAAARELARINTSTDWFLRLDADEVLHENTIAILRHEVKAANSRGFSGVEVQFYHHMVFPWLYQYTEPKVILFRKDSMSWENGVHELPQIRGEISTVPGVFFNHYGYCRGQEEVFKRWQLYVEIDGKPDWYAGRDPNTILSDRISVCQNYCKTHPKYTHPTLDKLFPNWRENNG
jgi:hypothetical protein